MNKLNGQVILITGASSGMGKAFAQALLKKDAIVYVAARRLEQMDDLKEHGALTLKMDITRDDEIQDAVQCITEQHGGVDVLINNAGFGMYGAMEDTSIDDARYQFEVNLFGLARLTQLLLPTMREKKAGKIINISSMGGKIYTPLGSWYHATKHALEGWSDCLRIELAQFGIDVVVIEPGIIQTEFGDVMLNPMIERSGDTAYSALANSVADATKASYQQKNGGSNPQVVVNAVMKAIVSNKPKTRYTMGKFAKLLIFIRKWFGDKVFDKVVLSAAK